jgi:hypothetical protein
MDEIEDFFATMKQKGIWKETWHCPSFGMIGLPEVFFLTDCLRVLYIYATQTISEFNQEKVIVHAKPVHICSTR